MAVSHKKQSLADQKGTLWQVINWLEEHLKIHETRRGVRELTRTKVNKKLSKGIVFFEDASELDAYMKDLR